jgi:predicted amidohydrolase
MLIKLSVIQFTPIWSEKKKNLQSIERLLLGLQSDIIILPELCTTGYSFLSKEEALSQAETESGETAQILKQLSARNKAVIIAGFVEMDGQEVYNSAMATLPNGDVKIYRKTHLFYKEKLCFAPGNSGFVVLDHPLKDCRMGVMICNDWRYPESARTLALMGADVIACPSNLISTVWGLAMPARALENKVYVAVANRCGTEKRLLEDGTLQLLQFNGNSVVYDFNGVVMTQAERECDMVNTTLIDPTLTRDKFFNAYNHLLDDRRPEFYKLS